MQLSNKKGFLSLLISHQAMIRAMAVRNIQSRYIGSYGGMFWLLVHPVSLVTVFYFVFAVGFRAEGPSDRPFLLWFVTGLAPWFYFNETLPAITNSVIANTHLVKKTLFPSELLAFINITSNLFSHVIFMLVIVVVMAFYDVPFIFERCALVYYIICNMILLMGLGWILSALQVFYRDTGHALTVILTLLFWMTPIVWNKQMIPDKYHILLDINPIYYIVEGYRSTLIYDSVVLPGAASTVLFWLVVSSILFAGRHVFYRLKPEFADVV